MDNLTDSIGFGESNRTEAYNWLQDESPDEHMMSDDVENAEKLIFDFEAYPICDGDKEGLVNLLTQIFLRADVDVREMADILTKQSPFGCVYRPAEEFMDEGDEGVVYGVLSMIKLGTDKQFQKDIWTLLKTKAKKYSIDKKILSILDKLSSAELGIHVGLLINERFLHFPAAIAAPAFKSLTDDLKNSGSQYCFSNIILILKIRIADRDSKEQSGAYLANMSTNERKLTKAQKRRIAANAVADVNVIYDNREEELLFQGDLQFDYFQYPVQSDVEKDSKFSSIVLKGVTYRPYRRVCFLETVYKQRNNKKVEASVAESRDENTGNFGEEYYSYLNCLEEFNVAADGKKLEAKTLLSTRNASLNKKNEESVPSSGWNGNQMDQKYNRAASISSFVSPFTKRSSFKKVATIASGSSASSVTSSIVSVTEEIQEINEENVFNYRADSFEEVTSNEIISSESSGRQESSKRSVEISSTGTKSMDIETKIDMSNSNSSEELLETTESESITTSKISNELSFSSNQTTKSRSVGFNKSNSGSNRKCESESRCRVDYRVFSGYSSNRSRSIDSNSSTDKRLKQSDIFWLPTSKDSKKDWKKMKGSEKRYVKNVGVQTVRSEPESVEPLPMFTPLLLRTITENMGGKNELETVSRVIQTHVELIKRQAWREKRILEEWDSIINDFERRCKFVNFQRLKFILHGNNHCFTS
uniref:Uncharacterized protein n=1 Tax=Setaria digitata TaxID=48799 RepID=A0A915PZN6_9BILA